MPLEARLLTSLALALAVVYWATPIAIRVADRFDFYDRPVGYKGHARPTPYLGGAAVVAGFVLALLALTGEWDRTLPLVGGVALLWLVGTVDDRRHVSPLLRVSVELGLAVLFWSLGLGWELGAGPAVDLAVTAFWIVAVVNAFNLFDNMDGAACSMAGIVAAGLAVFGVVEGDAWLAAAAAALAGACIGFLPHNLFSSPARIFLGDGGSMPVGFAVAALAMMGLTEATGAWQSVAMGLLFVGIPALDTCLVVVSRRRRKISILTGGRDHLTHRAHQRLRTARAVALSLGAAQAFVSVLAVIALQGGSVAIVLAVAVYVVGVGVAITLLDTRLAPNPSEPSDTIAALSAPPPRRRSRLEIAVPALLVPFGLLAGLSPFASGYYSTASWVPAGLVLVAVTTALAVARPVRLQPAGAVALGSLAGLGALSLASSVWSDSIQQAVVEGNRLLVYAVAFGGLLILVRTDRAAAWLLGAVAAGALTVALVILVRMLGGDGSNLFLNGRLNEPLGYINGQASLLLLGLWGTLAAVEQRRSAGLAAAGAASAALLASLTLLSQSRGVALAALLSLAAALVLFDGRLRRAWSYVAIGVGVLIAAPDALDVFPMSKGAAPPDSVVREAAIASIIGAIAAGAVWGVASLVLANTSRRRDLARLAGVVMAVLVAAAAAVAIGKAGAVRATVERQYEAFVQLDVQQHGSPVESGSRLVSGAGNRYDYWRVAWSAFKDRPILGWGAGNYDGPYFERRATTEDIRQPHSIQLQALSELGLIGALLVALLMAAAVWAILRARRAATGAETALAVAGSGMVVAWLVHSSVDWMHLLPGVTAGALAGFAVLLRPRLDRRPTARRAGGERHRPRVVTAVVVASVLAVAGLSLMRQAMTDHFRFRAENVLANDPARALVEADRALRLDPEAVPVYYVKAAALARFNQGEAARATLREAARREPRDFVTWALLGDLAVRMGDEAAAARSYQRAHRLNPRDPSLQQSAREPRAATEAAVR